MERGKKKKKKNRKLMAGSFILLSLDSFPNWPAPTFSESPKSAPSILLGVIWLHSVGVRVERAYSIVTGTVTSPPAGFSMFMFERRDVLGDIEINTFSVDRHSEL